MEEIALPVRAPPRTREGDGGAARFERIWADHYAAVHAHAVRRVGARADEVCSEVFLTAWRRLDQIPRDELRWLLATSRNVIGTLWRGDDRRARLQDRVGQQPPLAQPEQPLGLDADLSRALVQLDEIDRELLLLVYWEGLAPGRAAKVLGLAATTARTRLWRARRKLGHLLSEEDQR